MVDHDDSSPVDSLRWLVRQKQGRELLKWLAQMAGFNVDVFDKNNSQMSYAAGRRAVVVELLQHLKQADEQTFANFIGDIL